MDIKTILEQRGAKLKEAGALDLTKSDNVTRAEALHKEIESLDTQAAVYTRQLELAGQKLPVLSKQEERDFARFDYGKALRALANGEQLDGVEAEVCTEGRTEARSAGIATKGLVLPRIFVRRENRDMTATGTTSTTGDQGGMTIATEKRGLLDDFYNASVLRSAGATVLEGLTANLDLPRYVAGTASAGKAENGAADETSPTTAMLSLTPNRLPSYVDISEQLLRQSSVAIETVIRRNLVSQMLATQERAFFHGDGSNQANGIVGTSGIGSVAGGTNGLAPALSHIIGLETAVDVQNALLGSIGYITNAKVRGKLKQTAVISSTDSRVLWGDSGLLNGYRTFVTNAVKSDLDKGSSSGVCSAIVFGNFADYVIGYWGGISLELVRDKTNATTGLYTLVASTYYDGGVVRPKSFAAMLDALTT